MTAEPLRSGEPLDEARLAALTSFRELDQQAGLPKGRAFKAFKRLDPPLQEGDDFLLLSPQQHGESIRQLRQSGRIYPASIQVVLLHEAAAQRIAEQLSHE
jgi:hypothetical protein